MGRRPQAEPGLASQTECHTVKNVGEPCAGEPHARFDGEGLETEDPDHGGVKPKSMRETARPVRCPPTVHNGSHRASPSPNHTMRPFSGSDLRV